MNSITILRVRVDDETLEGALDRVAAYVVSRRPHQIATVNVEFIMAAQRDGLFREVLNASALNVPDSIGVTWAARRLGQPLRERVAGVDLAEAIVQQASRERWKVYLLGAGEGVALKAAEAWTARHPGFTCVGTYSGSPRAEDEPAIVERIRAARPDILFVAFGAPAQDLWISRNLERLSVPVCLGVGGVLDYAAGVTSRAPGWMRRAGLEWLYRLIRQPWRWRRMLALPRFAWRILRAREARRLLR